MHDISKGDWKKYREKIGDWQERYIEQLIKGYALCLSGDCTASEKFWELERRIKKDKKHLGVLIDVQKSSMLCDILHLINSNVITMEDLKDFSEDLQEDIQFFLRR
ncbi:multidrug transporter [Anaerovibrio sp.]|uniref:multidrug transporter n=1 Tax=Anaerovibrio sp. TaxID=1872532 RepID=UPI003F13C2B3